MDIDLLIKQLKSVRVDLETEKKAQACIEAELGQLGYSFTREHYLSDQDIPDFMISGICIEMKIKGTAKNIYRQLSRYAEHPDVTAIILITNRSIGLPLTINDKPAYKINLGSAWL